MKLNRHQKKFIEKNKKYKVVAATRVVARKRKDNGVVYYYNAQEIKDTHESEYLRVRLENGAIHHLNIEFLKRYELKWAGAA